ncbi:LacI family DNA-binding transcriptional regulator [Kiritimatiellaeota bacterium B1221]|nr:LacI family DNA-binding transcriptional regulator [Kiritimatiellaeota bacterium B1221]
MQTIADVIGCSKNTVSCALRNDSRISDKMKAEVRRVAKELGYRPNPLVSAHMQSLRKTHASAQAVNLAFLHSSAGEERWKERSFSVELFRGAEERASSLGYQLTPVWGAAPNMSSARLGSILKARGVRGLLIPLVEDTRLLRELNWDDFASAAMGFSLSDPPLHRAATFYQHAVPDALQYLQQAACARLGIIYSPKLKQQFDFAWEAGAAIAAAQCRHQKVPMYILRRDRIQPQSLLKWLRQYQIDGLISAGTRGIGWTVGKIREQLPAAFRHLSVLAERWEMDEGFVSGYYDRDWAGIGAAAVDLVVSQLYRNEYGIPAKQKTLLIEGEWRLNFGADPV